MPPRKTSPDDLAASDEFIRAAGQPFDDGRVEDYARARAKGDTIGQAGDAAGVGKTVAMRWQQAQPVIDRIRELRAGQETGHTVSVAWIVNELRINAQEARMTDPPQLKSSNESLKLLYDIVTKDKGMLGDLGQALPKVARDMREELTRRLSASSTPAFPGQSLDSLARETEGEPVER